VEKFPVDLGAVLGVPFRNEFGRESIGESMRETLAHYANALHELSFPILMWTSIAARNVLQGVPI
jgi:hypothetical protein